MRTDKPLLIKADIAVFYEKLSSQVSFYLDQTVLVTTLHDASSFS
jgi:hypothetical protein